MIDWLRDTMQWLRLKRLGKRTVAMKVARKLPDPDRSHFSWLNGRKAECPNPYKELPTRD